MRFYVLVVVFMFIFGVIGSELFRYTYVLFLFVCLYTHVPNFRSVLFAVTFLTFPFPVTGIAASTVMTLF